MATEHDVDDEDPVDLQVGSANRAELQRLLMSKKRDAACEDTSVGNG